jgi:hypothetical protein
MHCTRVEKFLPLHVAGDLAKRRSRAVESHLAACEKCRLSAGEYRASRDLFCAATLSPDFEGAFYEEIRNSVLDRIRRDRTLAPPTGFSRLFNARLAYAASLSLLIVAAALALHSYTRRTPEVGDREKMIAVAERERTASPVTIKSPQTIAQGNDERPTPRPSGERASGTTNREQRANGAWPPRPRANIDKARNAPPSRPNTASQAPSTAGGNTRPVTFAVTGGANAEEISAGGGNGGATNAQREVSRIEIQTSNPDIRIIWLSPKPEDPAHPLK